MIVTQEEYIKRSYKADDLTESLMELDKGFLCVIIGSELIVFLNNKYFLSYRSKHRLFDDVTPDSIKRLALKQATQL
jgi:hypothetical protein